jgi:molecular chaperone IbpA
LPLFPAPSQPSSKGLSVIRAIRWQSSACRGALAGFTPEEVTITAEQNVLRIEGGKTEKGAHRYLYQGISARPFRHVFNLADYVLVKGASFENGMLKIDLVRDVPEAMKPRQIPINVGSDNQQLDHKQAA